MEIKKYQKWTALVLVLCILFSMTGCADEEKEAKQSFSKEDTWVVYWYLCGSDLESNYGAATADLNEMMQVKLPENVKVVIQTGGASKWQNDQVKTDRIQRYEYSGDTLTLKDETEQASMGDPETLKGFLNYAEENYPADHKMLLFWNHGGGSVSGVSFDENYEMDSLVLDELSAVEPASDVADVAELSPPPPQAVNTETLKASAKIDARIFFIFISLPFIMTAVT